jgi:hypothetical protein
MIIMLTTLCMESLLGNGNSSTGVERKMKIYLFDKGTGKENGRMGLTHSSST